MQIQWKGLSEAKSSPRLFKINQLLCQEETKAVRKLRKQVLSVIWQCHIITSKVSQNMLFIFWLGVMV